MVLVGLVAYKFTPTEMRPILKFEKGSGTYGSYFKCLIDTQSATSPPPPSSLNVHFLVAGSCGAAIAVLIRSCKCSQYNKMPLIIRFKYTGNLKKMQRKSFFFHVYFFHHRYRYLSYYERPLSLNVSLRSLLYRHTLQL